jgi:type IV pilus assembly protein PilY1
MKKYALTSFLLATSLVSFTANAQLNPIPPNVTSTANRPMVMLSASKDVTMFGRAYTDFDDIDFDGKVDRTFMPAYKYYGYFDPLKCYSYSTADQRFNPLKMADTSSGGKYYCSDNGAEWSGNFLNWLSMSRIDILRKVLYGGLRSTDTATATTLELSFVPRNSQAIVKYYNGADLKYLTPFNSEDAKKKGMTFCRRPKENSGVSHDSAAVLTPEIRAAVGNLILWNMTEVKACNWSSELGYSWQTPTINFLNDNYVTPAGSTATAKADYKHLTSVPALGGDNKSFTARVAVCVGTQLGGEKCKNYGTIAAPKYKPIGLLHEFGESEKNNIEAARAEFGLMMGSYDFNLDAGVLRKNMGQINDEIDAATGVFLAPAAGAGGIIKSFNEITLYGYDVATGNYSQNCFSNSLTNGNCPSWGNPVGELLLESLRYFAGKTATNAAAGAKDTAVGLPSTAWTDPLKTNPVMGASTRTKLYGQPICRPLNMLTITSGASSYDNTLANVSQLGSASTATALTNTIGTQEGITNTTRLVGSVIGGTGANDQDLLCTPKLITGLGNVEGICSDGPNFKGSYLGSGVAYYANTNKIRTDFTAAVTPSDVPGNALMVKNYGISMSGGLATIEIPLPNGKKAFITPAARDYINTPNVLPANMVDFKYLTISADQKSGSALVLWQHAMLGEDQDQDQLQSLRWELVGTTLKVYTQAIESNTGSSQPMASGYTLVGTDADGVHLHSSINNYLTTETGVDTSLALYSGATVGAVGVGCQLSDRSLCVKIGNIFYRGETFKTYNATGATDALIREPLWYISKYGGFNYNTKAAPNSTSDPFPTATNKQAWDAKRADGKACGGSTGLSCSDNEPDNYFVARSPELLEKSLRDILAEIVATSNASPAVAAGQLSAGDLKYVAKFDPTDGHGELNAFALNGTTGFFNENAVWSAQTELSKVASISRPVITNEGATGVNFDWDALSAAKKTVLQAGETDAIKGPAFGKDMMKWLRGDTSNQSAFRVRSATSVLGSIVNSNPTVQSPPRANFYDPSYATFLSTWRTRKSLLWVGAGDGMLHAFEAGPTGGTPIMSYIPEPVFSRLPDWASPSTAKVQAFADGSPFTGDVKVGTDWRTYLFSSLGRGAKGMFALDVTDPAALSATNASNIFKWQFTSSDDAADLGYIVSEPTVNRRTAQSGQIAKMNNGKFAALFGNGVKSTSGNAVLYILFADGPTVGNWAGRYIKLTADTGPNNGLSQPVWVDENNDGIADSIYAGDLKGNLWKFNVSDANSANWAVAYSGKPLFIAKDSANKPLAITGAPEFLFHPLGGLMVNFASGYAVETGDFPSYTQNHAIFGIWDNPVFATTASSSLDSTLPRALTDLKARTYNNVGGSADTRTVTGTTIDWTVQKGWYLPFNVTSEMSVSNPVVANKQLIIVSVSPVVPKTAPAEPDACNVTPQARLTAIDPFTGMPNELLGTVDVVSGTVTKATPVASILISDQKIRISGSKVDQAAPNECNNGSVECSLLIDSKTVKAGDTDASCIKNGKNTCLLKSNKIRNRIFWREVPGLKTRAM